MIFQKQFLVGSVGQAQTRVARIYRGHLSRLGPGLSAGVV